MDRVQKVNLLLQLVVDREQILERLTKHAQGEQPPAFVGALSRRPRDVAEVASWRNPLAVLKAAIAAVPVMKYALGVAGLAAVVAIVTRGFGIDPARATVRQPAAAQATLKKA